MISPSNKKMKYYHLVVSITLYVDFWITSWILGNYRFQQGLEDKNFLNHRSNYSLIMCV